MSPWLPPTSSQPRAYCGDDYNREVASGWRLAQAARLNERRLFGWVPVEDPFSLSASRSPSSSNNRTATERFMPPRLAHTLIDTKSGAGSRTVRGVTPVGRGLIRGLRSNFATEAHPPRAPESSGRFGAQRPQSPATSRQTEMKQSEFLAKAWRLANDKARELGWIV